jgi:hypothetical protein
VTLIGAVGITDESVGSGRIVEQNRCGYIRFGQRNFVKFEEEGVWLEDIRMAWLVEERGGHWTGTETCSAILRVGF